MRSFQPCALLLVAVVLQTSCATASAPATTTDSGAAPGVSVFTVQNTDVAARDVVVYLEPEGRGQRQNLGTIGAGASSQFQHTADRGYYMLIAAHNLGELRSQRFNITGPSTVTWTMGANRVVVNRR